MHSPTLLGYGQDTRGLAMIRNFYFFRIGGDYLIPNNRWGMISIAFSNQILGELLPPVVEIEDEMIKEARLSELADLITSGRDLSLEGLSQCWNQQFEANECFENSFFGLGRLFIEFLYARGETPATLYHRLETTDDFWMWANIDPNDPAVEAEWQAFLMERTVERTALE